MVLTMMTQRRLLRTVERSRRDRRTTTTNVVAVAKLPLTILPFLLLTILRLQYNTNLFVLAVRNLQVAFPLQSLTIWDPEIVPPPPSASLSATDTSTDTSVSTTTTTNTPPLPPFTFRANFLSKFQKGLQAEVQARNALQQQQQQQQQQQLGESSSGGDGTTSLRVPSKGKSQKQHWATRAARNDQKQHQIREGIAERAYDEAIQQHEQETLVQQAKIKNPTNKKNPNRYQFVGVINSHHSNHQDRYRKNDPITWYTRTKPKNAKWTIRLVHVNRAAILKDLYNQKKIDIVAQYQNESTTKNTSNNNNNGENATPTTTTATKDASGLPPIAVTGQYRVRERSWKNLWNMSLKHMITDSSGMYWRERRIHSTNDRTTHQFLYTDGNNVYEATYRYMPDGRNGMHKVSTLAEFLNSRSIDSKMKQRIVHRLQTDAPDIVLEE